MNQLLRPSTLRYLYRARLRVNAVQESLAGRRSGGVAVHHTRRQREHRKLLR
jgi:hypothetical protein